MGKNKPYDALLQGSNRNYGTGIRTTDIRQAEFDSGEWKKGYAKELGKPF